MVPVKGCGSKDFHRSPFYLADRKIPFVAVPIDSAITLALQNVRQFGLAFNAGWIWNGQNGLVLMPKPEFLDCFRMLLNVQGHCLAGGAQAAVILGWGVLFNAAEFAMGCFFADSHWVSLRCNGSIEMGPGAGTGLMTPRILWAVKKDKA